MKIYSHLQSMIIFVSLLLPFVVPFASAQQSSHIVPRWIIGTWKGNIAYEHDTSSYLLRITIDSNATHNNIELISMKFKYDLVLDSIGTNMCRFKIIDSLDTTLKLIRQATFDIVKVIGWPKDKLHLQMYTENNQMWIGQLKKIKIRYYTK
jgi:hypothetical protein